jgi:hypothetical protein
MEDTSSFDSEAELDESRQSVCGDLVDLVGIEPTTSSMPWKRAPSCATGPREKHTSVVRGLKQLNSRLLAIDSQTRTASAASL